jgi:outer membrane lipoprotein-sorting protein
MKLKRILVLCASLVLCVIVVAGCGKSGPVSGSGSPQPSLAASNAPPSASQTTGIQSIKDLITQATQVQSMSLDFNVVSDGKTVAGSAWGLKGQKMKLQSTVKGTVYVILYNFADSTITTYQPASKTGTKAKMPAGTVAPESPDSYLSDVDAGKVQDLGLETVNGDPCRVIQFVSAKAKNATVKMWLSESLGFPIQIVSTATDGKVTQIDYTNIKIGALPDGTFDIPSDVKIKNSK